MIPNTMPTTPSVIRAAIFTAQRAPAGSTKWMEWGKFLERNPFAIQSRSASVIHLWREFPPEHSPVQKIEWQKDGSLRGICGTTEPRGFVISSGRLTQIARITPSNRSKWELAEPSKMASVPKILNGLRLPHRQGRQFLAKPSCWAPWNKGRLLVGTLDGMLARFSRKSRAVFALGAVAPHGPIHQIVVNAARTVAYGVAGDANDLGLVFRYDDVDGAVELGRTLTSEAKLPGLANSCQPSCLALSPDEKSLAIGVADRLGCIYVFSNLERQDADIPAKSC